MARNKYPEQTIERILNVSTKLFLEKGYDNTTLQDILNELKDLTRGAIYHHFKSKEDVFDAVVKKMGKGHQAFWSKLMEDQNLSGADKLKQLFRLNILSESTKRIMQITPNLLDNPRFLANQLKEIQDVVTPKFIAPIIEQGVKDGSIKTDKPYELAEVITLLLNVWINPLILGSNMERLYSKCMFVNELIKQYNIILFDDETISQISQL